MKRYYSMRPWGMQGVEKMANALLNTEGIADAQVVSVISKHGTTSLQVLFLVQAVGFGRDIDEIVHPVLNSFDGDD